MDVEKRIRKLEREARVWRVLAISIGMILCAGIAIGALQQRDATFGTITANKIRVVNHLGPEGITLTVSGGHSILQVASAIPEDQPGFGAFFDIEVTGNHIIPEDQPAEVRFRLSTPANLITMDADKDGLKASGANRRVQLFPAE